MPGVFVVWECKVAQHMASDKWMYSAGMLLQCTYPKVFGQ